MSEAAWETALALVLRHEGGWADHPKDPGGATKFGISLRYLQGLKAAGDLNGDGVVDTADVRGLSVEDAAAIYKRDWWDRHGYAQLADPVAVKLMDLAVNMGAGRAHRLLQRAVNGLAVGKIAVDGVLGPQTLAAANALPADRVVAALRRQAEAFYLQLIAARPELAVFRRGWISRARA